MNPNQGQLENNDLPVMQYVKRKIDQIICVCCERVGAVKK